MRLRVLIAGAMRRFAGEHARRSPARGGSLRPEPGARGRADPDAYLARPTLEAKLAAAGLDYRGAVPRPIAPASSRAIDSRRAPAQSRSTGYEVHAVSHAQKRPPSPHGKKENRHETAQ
jgi:hypothetical protein